MRSLSLLFLAITTCNNIQSSLGVLNIPLNVQKVPKNVHASKTIRGHKGRATSDDIKLKTMDDFYYTSIIGIGNPPQKITVMFDTGVGLSWVASEKMCRSNKKYCQRRKTYKHERSSTYEADGREYAIKYESYRPKYLIGFISKDVVTIGKLSVTGQLFAEITDMDEQTRNSNYEGVLGLSFTTEGDSEFNDVVPVFINMVRNKIVGKAVFAFFLSRVGVVQSVLSLGGVDKTKFKGKFITAHLISNDKWMINVDKIFAGDTLVSLTIPTLIKTGTTAISGPEAVINNIIRVIGAFPSRNDDLYYVECAGYTSLPSITFYVDNKPLIMTASDYVITFDDAERGMACWLGMQGFQDLNFLILGDTFLRAFYTKFDVRRKEISFAPAVKPY